MPKTGLLFGSIGSIVESSDIQRRAYNQALEEAGLAWVWDRETYETLLMQAGGKERVAMLASATGTNLSTMQIETIHARKTEVASEELVRNRVSLRPGVAELIASAKQRGMKLGFVTTTYQPNIDAIFAAAGDALSAHDFDVIVSRADVERGKPAPDAYRVALERLGIAAGDALAVEDTANSVMAAKRAGITVVATPGEFSKNQDFWQADLVVERLAHDGVVDQRVTELLG